jgi:hypothetical protein
MRDPEYIGDGVYVGHDGFHFILRTDSHLNQSGQIFLEPSVLQNLIDYATRIKEKANDES